VGEPCDGQSDCTPIPAGIAELVEVLNAATEQQAQDPSCDGVR
jgi:hypothetical protein